MGFIEDERRRKALNIKAQAESQIAGEKKRQQEEQAYKEREALEKVLEKQAEEHFRKSGLGLMIEELGRLGSHKEAGTYPFLGEFHAWINIRKLGFGYDEFGGFSTDRTEKIRIRVTAEGTIVIEAGRKGSTTIGFNKWQRNSNEVEKALGKAYKNPRISTPTGPSESAGPGL